MKLGVICDGISRDLAHAVARVLRIPALTTLAGQSLFQQWVVLDPAANRLTPSLSEPTQISPRRSRTTQNKRFEDRDSGRSGS